VIEALLGQVLVKAEKIEAGDERCDNDQLVFWLADGRVYMFTHDQDCCELVYIESIVGDLNDLVGAPLLMAEEVVSEPEIKDCEAGDDGETWTFYKFATLKGYVDVRWIGSSNGYYSESVDHGFLDIEVQKQLPSS
jgi:hypothetical protein